MSIATALARGLDPTAMADELDMKLDPWQREFLSSDRKRILVNCYRQSGKSTYAAIKAVHKAVYRPHALVLILSPSMRQSAEVVEKCVTIYHGLGKPVVAEAENMHSLVLENRSRIIGLPGSAATVRGYSGVDLIVVDEAAYTRDELPAAVSPMLAVSGGSLYALSTPHGKRGWWWDAWENGGAHWLRIKATVQGSPRISREYQREERLRLGERSFRQEYMCEFLEIVDQAFGAESVNAAFDRSIEPLGFDELPEA